MVAYASAGVLLDGGSAGGWDSGASSYSSDAGLNGWNGGAAVEEEVQVVRVQEHAHHAPAPLQVVKVNLIILFFLKFMTNAHEVYS